MTVVYTCVTGDYDDLRQFSNAKFDNLDAEYFIYTDQKIKVEGWTVNPIQQLHLENVRVARWYKTHPHELFPSASATIWIDGNQVPCGPANEIIKSGPLGAFKHPKRDCIYDELHACFIHGKDWLPNMSPQTSRYRKEGYPEHNGLAETSCVYRENTYQNNEFNELWWKEIIEHSHRDQLSFDYIAWKLGIKYNIIPGCRIKSDFLRFTGNH